LWTTDSSILMCEVSGFLVSSSSSFLRIARIWMNCIRVTLLFGCSFLNLQRCGMLYECQCSRIPVPHSVNVCHAHFESSVQQHFYESHNAPLVKFVRTLKLRW